MVVPTYPPYAIRFFDSLNSLGFLPNLPAVLNSDSPRVPSTVISPVLGTGFLVYVVFLRVVYVFCVIFICKISNRKTKQNIVYVQREPAEPISTTGTRT